MNTKQVDPFTALIHIEPILPQLEQLAASWLVNGATHFGVLLDGQELYCWPRFTQEEPFTMRAPVNINLPFKVEIGVICPPTFGNKARLGTDAALLSKICL